MTDVLSLAREVLRLRLSQLLINERYKAGAFKVPIHLALGHEAVALGVSGAMAQGDQLLLPHRNLHYNLARGASLKAVVDEFLLRPSGLAGGLYGSMNLINPDAGVIYSSSILGNNLCVATGVAMAERVSGSGCVTFVVTGDGAMEEGSFYEMLTLMAGQELAAVVIVENNEWSLASRIEERRGPIDVGGLARACGADYLALRGNDVVSYGAAFAELRCRAAAERRPMVVEAELKTLGDWRQPTPEFPDGKYINYHAGPAPTTSVGPWPLMAEHDGDPLFVLLNHLDEATLRAEAEGMLARLEGELS